MGSTYTNPWVKALDEFEEKYKHILLNKAIAYAHEAKAYRDTLKAQQNTLESLDITNLISGTQDDWSLYDSTMQKGNAVIEQNVNEGDGYQAKKLKLALDGLEGNKRTKDKVDNALNNIALITNDLTNIDPLHNTGASDDEGGLPQVALDSLKVFEDTNNRAMKARSLKEIAEKRQQLNILSRIKEANADSLAKSFNPVDRHNAGLVHKADILTQGGQYDEANIVLSNLKKYEVPESLTLLNEDRQFITGQEITTTDKSGKEIKKPRYQRYGTGWAEWSEKDKKHVRTDMTDVEISQQIQGKEMINKKKKLQSAKIDQLDNLYVGQINNDIEALHKAGKVGLTKYDEYRKGEGGSPEAIEGRLSTDAKNILNLIYRTDDFTWDNSNIKDAWNQYEKDADAHTAAQIVINELTSDKENFDRAYKGTKVDKMNHRQLLDKLVNHYSGSNPLNIDLSDENPSLKPPEQAVDGQNALLIDYLQAVTDNNVPLQKELLEKLRAFKSLGTLDYSNMALP